MSLEEFDSLRAQLSAAHEENGRLVNKLEAALQSDPADRVPPLIEALKAALPIIRFGVSNLDPRTITRWPYKELRAFADALEQAPLGPDILECAIELRAFSDEIKLIELDRDERGIYDGPDPVDVMMLRQFASGEFTRIGALVDAGYLTAAITDEGREAIQEGSVVQAGT